MTELPGDAYIAAITVGELARIYAELRRAGAMIGERDLQIAATAAAGGHQVLTRNVDEFRRVSGLQVLTVGDVTDGAADV